MKQKNLIIGLFLLICLFGLSSCAPGGDTDKEYGFFGGFIHGWVLVFALIGKLFGGDYGIYAENNTGFTYWLGFIIGLGILGGGGGAVSRRN